MSQLEERVAIVTGAGRGIGAAFAEALAAKGAKVALFDVIDTTSTLGKIQAAGGEAISVACDVTDTAQVEEAVLAAVSAFGKVDILVNNAALFSDLPRCGFMEITEAEWDRVMQVNTRGVFTCIKKVVPEMRRNGYGKIVNIASGTVFKGTPLLLHYVASKGAVVALTRSVARELGGDGICVNALAPGMTMSENVIAQGQYEQKVKDANIASRAIQREETPQDLVGALVFLCSKDSDFMTGQTLVVDGGSVMI